jgi:lipopolysaccharide transport system permease protein
MLWSRRALLLGLVRRQFQVRYRQSAGGVAWALIPPLATLGMGALIFNEILGVDTGRASYGVFAMAGLVPWTFFANSVQLGVPSVAQGITMVTRLAFPRGVLPLSMVGLSFVDLLVASVAFVAIALISGEGLPLTALWAPALLLVEIPLVVGVVLLGAALNVFARDIRLAVPLLVQLWLFLTPVLYRLPEERVSAFMVNPMTGLVLSFRRVLVDGLPPDITILGPSIVGAVVLLALGWWYFSATEVRFADVI